MAGVTTDSRPPHCQNPLPSRRTGRSRRGRPRLHLSRSKRHPGQRRPQTGRGVRLRPQSRSRRVRGRPRQVARSSAGEPRLDEPRAPSQSRPRQPPERRQLAIGPPDLPLPPRLPRVRRRRIHSLRQADRRGRQGTERRRRALAGDRPKAIPRDLRGIPEPSDRPQGQDSHPPARRAPARQAVQRQLRPPPVLRPPQHALSARSRCQRRRRRPHLPAIATRSDWP